MKMEDNSTITITKREYFELKCAEIQISMLEAGGVDNWDWYGEALNPEGELSYREEKAQLHKELFGE